MAALACAGCFDMMDMRETEMASRGLSKADLEAPPSDNEIRARITNDVRDMWLPEAELHKGTAECAGIKYEGIKPLCAYCKGTPMMKVFTLRADPPDRQFPVRETTYFCPTESAYWYHYEGGPLKKDVWLGPRRIKLRKPEGVPEEEPHH